MSTDKNLRLDMEIVQRTSGSAQKQKSGPASCLSTNRKWLRQSRILSSAPLTLISQDQVNL